MSKKQQTTGLAEHKEKELENIYLESMDLREENRYRFMDTQSDILNFKKSYINEEYSF